MATVTANQPSVKTGAPALPVYTPAPAVEIPDLIWAQCATDPAWPFREPLHGARRRADRIVPGDFLYQYSDCGGARWARVQPADPRRARPGQVTLCFGRRDCPATTWADPDRLLLVLSADGAAAHYDPARRSA